MVTSTEISTQLYAIVRGFVGKQIQDKNDRDDVVQNIFMKIHEKIAGLQEMEKVNAWVFKTAQNAIYDYYRAKKGKENAGIELVENTNFKEAEDQLQTMNNCINPFINKLPLPYKQVIEMSELQGLKRQTIADQLNLGLSAVKSRAQRGKKMIKDMFIDCCAFTLDEKGNLKGEHKDPSTCTKCKS